MGRGDHGGGAPDLVLLTVRDGQIAQAAADLAARDLPPAIVLHTSGALASDVLAPLADRGWATGSMAPVVSIADPERDAPKLIGAWFAVEGDPRATAAAHHLVASLGGHVLPLDRESKPVYHAAAVFASNFLVALLAVAERVMGEAGIDPESARSALATLAEGSLANVRDLGPDDALTGPVSRGDVDTIARHLSRLSPADAHLYSVLAREALEIARRRGLDADTADRIARTLHPSADR